MLKARNIANQIAFIGIFNLVLLLVPAIVFSPVLFLDFEYTSDDGWMLLNNSNIWDKDIYYVLKTIFTQFDYGQYSPLNTLLYRFTYQAFGMIAWAFHGISFILHLSNISLVYVLLGRISVLTGQRNDIGCLVAALFYGILPVHAETICWISASKILGCTFFSLLALLSFLKSLSVVRGSIYFEIAAVCCVVMAFGFKEQAIVVPPILIVLDMLRKRPLLRVLFRRIHFLVLSIMGVYWSYLGSMHLINVFEVNERSQDLLHIIGLPLYCLLAYVFNVFLPFKLAVRYFEPSEKQYRILLTIGPLLLYCIGRYILPIFRKNESFLFGLAFFAISISCFLNIVLLPRPSVIADRYLYFPSIGIAIMISHLFRYRNVMDNFFILIYFLILCATTYLRCKNWAFI